MQRTNQSLNSILKLRKNLTDTGNEGGEPVRLQIILEDVMGTLEPQIAEAGGQLNSDVLEVQHVMFPYMHFKSVMYNLISNAIKFTPKEGEVIVDVKQDEETVEVLVSDTGTGMSEESRNKLFGDEHFTTKGTSNEAGTGLGLMICKEFLKKNGGNIHVESELGKGSTFAFTLPRA